MFAVCATLALIPDHFPAGLALLRRQAANSLDREPDCHRFDLCIDAARHTVFLYELYSDAAAFDAHLKTPHFATFDAAIGPMLADKQVATYPEVERNAL